MSVFPALFRIAATAPRPTVLAGAFACLLVLGASGCRPLPGKEPMPAPSRPLSEVLAAHTPELMAIPGVVGTAESLTTDGRPCILVLLAKSDPDVLAKLPSQLEGWPVRVEVTGWIRALPDSSG